MSETTSSSANAEKRWTENIDPISKNVHSIRVFFFHYRFETRSLSWWALTSRKTVNHLSRFQYDCMVVAHNNRVSPNLCKQLEDCSRRDFYSRQETLYTNLEMLSQSDNCIRAGQFLPQNLKIRKTKIHRKLSGNDNIYEIKECFCSVHITVFFNLRFVCQIHFTIETL